MKVLLTLVCFLMACRPERTWLPTERWAASPAMSLNGVWMCTGVDRKDWRYLWRARLDKDGYYRCYAEDAPEKVELEKPEGKP